MEPKAQELTELLDLARRGDKNAENRRRCKFLTNNGHNPFRVHHVQQCNFARSQKCSSKIVLAIAINSEVNEIRIRSCFESNSPRYCAGTKALKGVKLFVGLTRKPVAVMMLHCRFDHV